MLAETHGVYKGLWLTSALTVLPEVEGLLGALARRGW